MSSDGFELEGMDLFSKKLLGKATQLPKESKKILRKIGTKGRTLTAKKARQMVKKGINDKDKQGKNNYHKSFKRGKFYIKNGIYSIRVYNNSYHGHLIEKGHRIVDKNGQEHGFVEGKHVIEKSMNEFEPIMGNLIEDWIDDLLEDMKI